MIGVCDPDFPDNPYVIALFSFNISPSNMSAAEIASLTSQIAYVNQTIATLQAGVLETATDSALLWRMTSGIFVFLMQVNFVL